MSYAIVDAELREQLPDVELGPRDQGVALLLRLDGRPVHFALHAFPAGSRIPGARLWEIAGPAAGREALAVAIREELAALEAPPPADVTVAVCTHGRTALLADLLTSLASLRADPGRPPVLVVDNAPPDDATRRLVESTPGVAYTCEPRPGLDFARNRALRESQTTFVAYLDDDVVVDPGWLAGLDEAVAENPDAGALTGLVLPRALDTDAQVLFERRGGFRRGTRKIRYHGQWQPGNPYFPVGAGIFGAGANMVVRRDLVLELGGFDEALDTGAPLPGGGDLDIFQRVVRSGAPLVYEPSMLVFHLHRPDLAGLRRQYRTWGEGFVAYVEKTYAADPGQRVKLRGLMGWWLRDMTRHVLRSLRHPRAIPPRMPAAEFAGGVRGIGGYRRSRDRVARIGGRHG